MKLNKTLKIYKLPKETDTQLNSKYDIIAMDYPAQPQFGYGFNHFLWQSYELFNDMLNKHKGKTFYNIINQFEMLLIDQQRENELFNNIKTYLDIDKEQIHSTIFLHLWEIIFISHKGISPSDTSNLINNKSSVFINTTNENDIKSAINSFAKKILKKTDIKYVDKSKNNDLTIIMIDEYKTLLDQESYCFIELFKKVINSFDNLNDDGNMVIRLNDTFTIPTNKMIMLCNILFDTTYIYKPYYSRLYESEKYLICKTFNKTKYNKISKKLTKLSSDINDKQFIIDFMSDITISPSLMTVLADINIFLSGLQHKEKNKIMTYVNSNDYFGNTYQEANQEQFDCVEFFVSHFFPINQNDFIALQKQIAKIQQDNIIFNY